MRIAWYSPLSTTSAIAEYSVHVAGSLASRHEVDIWAAGPQPWRAAPVPVIAGGHTTEQRLAAYDHVIYNLGDHAPFHESVRHAASRYPGICLLHDRTYDNLIQQAPPGVSSSRVVIAGAHGVLVHAADHAQAVEAEWFGPVGRIQFPVFPRHLASSPNDCNSRKPGARILVTAGYVNRNRQIHRVLDLLGKDPELKKRVRYVVVGTASDEGYAAMLRGKVEQLRLHQCVELVFGYCPDAEFRRYLSSADAFVNLREPPSESASASLHEQLACGKPVIVSDVGYFSEVPDDVVLKIPCDDDRALSQALWEVAAGDSGAAFGSRARDYVSTLTVEGTCNGIVSFLDEARQWRPLLDLASRAAGELAAFGATTDAAAIDRVAEQLAIVARA